GWCPCCRKWMSALPLPPTTVLIGENAKIYTCYLSVIMRLSFEQIHTLLTTTYRFSISDGEISNILEHEATHLRPEYEALKNEFAPKEASTTTKQAGKSNARNKDITPGS
ncbi:MAG TPA: hypothetical protein VHK27_05360, partial [Gammaproteobacteria bacterium]|nr:hypothetical protein [Gammaproteobacteria bacterium]